MKVNGEAMIKNILHLIIIFLIVSAGAFGMGTTKEHFEKDITIHSDLNYLLYLPKDYNSTGKPFPLIVFLHGAGERGNNLDQVKTWGIANIVEHDSNFPFIVVSPQCPADSWWLLKIPELKGFIDEMKTKYNVDKSRVYLTGLSMGGFATWALAAQYPNDFAAIAPVCGGGEIRLAMHGAYKMPIWVFHGAKDSIIPIQRSQEMVDEIKKQGGDVKFTIYPDLDHNCWDAAYSNKELYTWFLSHMNNSAKK
jgi:predicted peptidase